MTCFDRPLSPNLNPEPRLLGTRQSMSLELENLFEPWLCPFLAEWTRATCWTSMGGAPISLKWNDNPCFLFNVSGHQSQKVHHPAIIITSNMMIKRAIILPFPSAWLVPFQDFYISSPVVEKCIIWLSRVQGAVACGFIGLSHSVERPLSSTSCLRSSWPWPLIAPCHLPEGCVSDTAQNLIVWGRL